MKILSSLALAGPLLGGAFLGGCATVRTAPAGEAAHVPVQYLEIITEEVDDTCAALEAIHGVTFTEALPHLANSRMAALADGGRIGVRAPLGDAEQPIVRIYARVDDVQAATEAAEEAGCTIAMWPMALPGDEGTFSIYHQGGNEYGLWQPAVD